MESLNICLPKGEHLDIIAEYLKDIKFPIDGYRSDNRNYRVQIGIPGTRGKIFAEKDVAIQVATGNYAVGFCGDDWISEHTKKFADSNINIFRRLKKSVKKIYCCSHKDSEISDAEALIDKSKTDVARIVTEYPNLLEDEAINLGLKKFNVLPVWGSVEAYPPEHADIAALSGDDPAYLHSQNLKIIKELLDVDLCVIVNRKLYETTDLTPVIKYFANR